CFCNDFQEFVNLTNSSIYSPAGVHIGARSNLRIKENQPFCNKIVP
ncbi:unnamed protein product, partial [Rotaria sp. Silwood2]